MRLAFAGTPEFAAKALEALYRRGHEIAVVLTQPDRAVGRGLRLSPSAVKQFAVDHGLQVAQPIDLKSGEVVELLRRADVDALVVSAYGMLLPPALLDVARFGAINIHASLLPRWRGAAPIQRALLAGDTHTGVSIMRMEAGLDTGPVFDQRPIEIHGVDDAGTLHDRLAQLGSQMILDVLDRLPGLHPVPQSPEGVTYAAKVTKADTMLDWHRSAVDLSRVVRAFRPGPGAVTALGGEALKIWHASVVAGEGAPGALIGCPEGALTIACGTGALAVTELQRPGGRRMSTGDFLRGHPLQPGTRFG